MKEAQDILKGIKDYGGAIVDEGRATVHDAEAVYDLATGDSDGAHQEYDTAQHYDHKARAAVVGEGIATMQDDAQSAAVHGGSAIVYQAEGDDQHAEAEYDAAAQSAHHLLDPDNQAPAYDYTANDSAYGAADTMDAGADHGHDGGHSDDADPYAVHGEDYESGASEGAYGDGEQEGEPGQN